MNIDLIMVTAGSQGEQDRKHLPLGLLYVGSILKAEGFDVRIYHILPSEFGLAKAEIIKRNPLWIGLSVLSGTTTYHAAVYSKELKKALPGTPVVWGGHHPSNTAQQCLEQGYVDIAVKGEGEITALELSRKLSDKKPLDGVKGISFKKDGRVIHNENRELIQDLDSLPLDYSLLDMDYYIGKKERRNVSFFGSRGCPFNCAFCSTPKFTGKVYRFHSKDYILGHLQPLKEKYGLNSVYFSDDNFFVNKERAYSILCDMHEKGIYCHTFDVRLNQLEEEDCAKLNELNTRGIFFGWESGCDRLLKLIRKGFNTEYILKKAEMLRKFKNLRFWGSGIMLLPTETLEETRQTIAFSCRLRKLLPNSTIGLFRFMCLPGTDLTGTAVSEGFVLPSGPEGWRVIDPMSSDYSAPWVKWMTEELDKKVRYVQEYSRSGIMNYINNKNILEKSVKNWLAGSMNKRCASLDFSFLFEPALYNMALKTYNVLLGRDYQMLGTEILRSGKVRRKE